MQKLTGVDDRICDGFVCREDCCNTWIDVKRGASIENSSTTSEFCISHSPMPLHGCHDADSSDGRSSLSSANMDSDSHVDTDKSESRGTSGKSSELT